MPRGVLCVTVVAAVLIGATGCATTGGSQSLSTGAGGEMLKSLSGSAWQVEEIGGQPVLDKTKTALRFGDDGRVSGSSGCNRFSGQAETSGAALKFAPLAMTRMACPPEAMEQERRFAAALEGVCGWSLEPGGRLKLADAGGNALLRLSPVKP